MSNLKPTKFTIEEKHELGVTFWRIDGEAMMYPQDFPLRELATGFVDSLKFETELVEVA